LPSLAQYSIVKTQLSAPEEGELFMNDLLPSDEEFFSDPANWGGGPMYEVRLVYPVDYPRANISQVLIEYAGLVPWEPRADPAPKLIKSIFSMDGLASVIFIHHYAELLQGIAEYTLGIFPEQFKRVVGSKPGDRFATMDLARLRLMHKALFQLVTSMNRETPLLSAAICREDWGHIGPQDCGQALCVSAKLARLLDLPARAIPAMDYYVALDLNH